MSIFSRTRDIVAANMADLLDRADDPAKTIRIIIMEMEETLVEVRSSAARNIADQKEMRRHLSRLTTIQESWTEKAQLALSKDREDLARGALLERKKAADMAVTLSAEIELLNDALRANEQDIANLQAKLREARTRQNAINVRIESANHRARLRDMVGGARTTSAFARFAELEREADLAEGHADAIGLGMTAPHSLEDEIDALKPLDGIDDELAMLKAEMAKGSNN